ncbi:MAG: hypothetical protein RL208_85 [Pseudomonadota bacterium]|jgi:protein-arginine kinase
MFRNVIMLSTLFVAMNYNITNADLSQPTCFKVADEVYKGVDYRNSPSSELYHILKSGIENPDSKMGCYAFSANSYVKFDKFFNKIIEIYHKIDPEKNIQNFDTNHNKLNKLHKNDKQNVISTRVRVIRNFANFNFPSKMTKEDRLKVEEQFLLAIQQFPQELQGKYYPLSTMSEAEKEDLTKQHLLFQDLTTDKYLKSAGIADDYPTGRGVFVSNDKHLAIWVNEEDHLRITSIYNGYNFKATLKRIADANKFLSKTIQFAKNKNIGYLASCPTNIGTGMRASVMVNVPSITKENLSENKNKFKALNLQIRGSNGENSTSNDTVYDISNSVRLGKTEVELIKDLDKKLFELGVL